DGSEHKIEILGDGQQYVLDGIHPETHKPYGWFGGELTTIKRQDLPYTRFDDAKEFINAARKLLVEEFGFEVTNASSNLQSKGGGPHPAQTNGRTKAPKAPPGPAARRPPHHPHPRRYRLGTLVHDRHGGLARHQRLTRRVCRVGWVVEQIAEIRCRLHGAE